MEASLYCVILIIVEGLFVPVKRHILFFVFVVSVVASYVVARTIMGTIPAENPVALPPLPIVSFYDKSGKKLTLDDFKGRVVLVNLWATWCPPCVAELPSLERLQKKLPADKFAVVAISLDTTSMKVVADFLKKQHLETLAVYWDKDRQMPLKWKYDGLPTSFLLDREGNVVKRYDGAYEWDEVIEVKALALK